MVNGVSWVSDVPWTAVIHTQSVVAHPSRRSSETALPHLSDVSGTSSTSSLLKCIKIGDFVHISPFFTS